MTTPQLFDTTGMDSTTLNLAALFLSQNLANGTPTKVNGPYAQQLVSLAGAQMNSQGLVTSTTPSFSQNMESALKDFGPTAANAALLTSPIAPLIIGKAAVTGKGVTSLPAKGQSISGWIMAGAGNYSLIAFGAIIAIAALIYSQREHITTVVKQAGKIAAVAA